MTRRCSVMRMPVAAQRASIPVALGTGVDFNAVMIRLPSARMIRSMRSGKAIRSCGPYKRLSATPGALRQVATHQKCVQLFPVGLPVVALATPDDGETGPFVEPPRRLIVFLDLEEH